jgi:hypothetical protein
MMQCSMSNGNVYGRKSAPWARPGLLYHPALKVIPVLFSSVFLDLGLGPLPAIALIDKLVLKCTRFGLG